MNPVAFILLSGVLGVSGQLLLKRAVATLGPIALRPETLPDLMLALALNPLVVLGLVVYLSGTFFWLISLSRVDLSFAYPFASLNHGLILIGSWWWLGEQPSPTRLIGVAIICLGVWAISRTPTRTSARAAPPTRVPAGAIMGGSER